MKRNYIIWAEVDQSYFIKGFSGKLTNKLIKELPVTAIPIFLKLLEVYKNINRVSNFQIKIEEVDYLTKVTLVNPNLRMFRNYLMFCKIRKMSPGIVLEASSDWRAWKEKANKFHFGPELSSPLKLWMDNIDPDYRKMKNPFGKHFLDSLRRTHIVERPDVIKDIYLLLKKLLRNETGINYHTLDYIVLLYVEIGNMQKAKHLATRLITEKPQSLHDRFLPFQELIGFTHTPSFKTNTGYSGDWFYSMAIKACNAKDGLETTSLLKKLTRVLLNIKYLDLAGWKVTDKNCMVKAEEIISKNKYGPNANAIFAEESSKHNISPTRYPQNEKTWLTLLNNLTHQNVPAPGGVNGITIDNITLFQMDKTDPRAFYIGEYTGCCQNINGVGSTTVVSSVRDPHAALWVVKINDTIVAQSFVWVNITDGVLIIDNIEALGHHKYVDKIKELYYTALKSIKGTFGLNTFYQGVESNDVVLYDQENTSVHNKHIPYMFGVYSDALRIVKLEV